jgi:hypothetical protein
VARYFCINGIIAGSGVDRANFIKVFVVFIVGDAARNGVIAGASIDRAAVDDAAIPTCPASAGDVVISVASINRAIVLDAVRTAVACNGVITVASVDRAVVLDAGTEG